MFIYNIDIYILYHTQLQIISDGWEHAVVIEISDFYYLNLFYSMTYSHSFVWKFTRKHNQRF